MPALDFAFVGLKFFQALHAPKVKFAGPLLWAPLCCAALLSDTLLAELAELACAISMLPRTAARSRSERTGRAGGGASSSRHSSSESVQNQPGICQESGRNHSSPALNIKCGKHVRPAPYDHTPSALYNEDTFCVHCTRLRTALCTAHAVCVRLCSQISTTVCVCVRATARAIAQSESEGRPGVRLPPALRVLLDACEPAAQALDQLHTIFDVGMGTGMLVLVWA